MLPHCLPFHDGNCYHYAIQPLCFWKENLKVRLFVHHIVHTNFIQILFNLKSVTLNVIAFCSMESSTAKAAEMLWRVVRNPAAYLNKPSRNLKHLQASDRLMLDLSLKHKSRHGVKYIPFSGMAQFQRYFTGNVNQDRCSLTSHDYS